MVGYSCSNSQNQAERIDIRGLGGRHAAAGTTRNDTTYTNSPAATRTARATTAATSTPAKVNSPYSSLKKKPTVTRTRTTPTTTKTTTAKQFSNPTRNVHVNAAPKSSYSNAHNRRHSLTSVAPATRPGASSKPTTSTRRSSTNTNYLNNTTRTSYSNTHNHPGSKTSANRPTMNTNPRCNSNTHKSRTAVKSRSLLSPLERQGLVNVG